MPIQKQLTGMQGVFLVAAELSRRGFIVSPTSRNARGADLLVTDQNCKSAFSVSVKTNASTFSFWLMDAKAREMHSPSHVYVLVNLRRNRTEYFVVPSKVVAENIKVSKSSQGTVWYEFHLAIAKQYENNWALFAQDAEEPGV